MFKRAFITLFAIAGIAFLLATPAAAKKSPPPRMCLNPGSYIFTLKYNSIYRVTMDSGQAKDITKIRILPEAGWSPNEHIAPSECDVFFAWAKDVGKQPDIWAVNASTGYELRRLTNTPFTTESNPAINHWGDVLTFEERNDLIESIVSVSPDGGSRTVVTRFAYSPSWGPAGELTYTQADGYIYIWGVTGQWHTYTPDGSAILVQNGQDFTRWPTYAGGPPKFFGTYRSVAFRPGGGLAAVVTLEGNLEFLTLDKDWLPYGDPIPGPGLSDLTFVTWIEVP